MGPEVLPEKIKSNLEELRSRVRKMRKKTNIQISFTLLPEKSKKQSAVLEKVPDSQNWMLQH